MGADPLQAAGDALPHTDRLLGFLWRGHTLSRLGFVGGSLSSFDCCELQSAEEEKKPVGRNIKARLCVRALPRTVGKGGGEGGYGARDGGGDGDGDGDT